MTTTPTSGAADLPEALIGAIMAAAYDFRDAHISGSKNLKRTAHAELESTVRNTLHALAAGQATAAQAVVQDDLITLRKPTTSAELLWLLKLAHLVISDVGKTIEAAFAPTQPAAQQGAAYAALPEKYYLAGGEVPTWDAKQMRAFADATCDLRASRGQALGESNE